MNIKLSVCTNRVKGKSGYAVYIDGDVKASNVGGLTSNNIKEDILNKLAKGLRACREFVSHEDILYIEIQNQHLCSWLDGKVEYKGYSEGLDSVFEVLESLDCRYKFMFVKVPICSKMVESYTGEKSKGMSVEDAFSDM